MADSTTDYNNLDPLGDEAAVVDEVDAAVSGARKKPRAVDMVPEEPDAMAPDEEYQLTPAGAANALADCSPGQKVPRVG